MFQLDGYNQCDNYLSRLYLEKEFTREILIKKVIHCSYKKIFEFIWNIKQWSSFWSPLRDVEVLYDDSSYQEFNMFVLWEEAISVVRTVRFKSDEGNIYFFSPQSPPPTKLHRGSWHFVERGDGNIEITAYRFFSYPYEDIDEFTMRFHRRLEILLNKMAEICCK